VTPRSEPLLWLQLVALGAIPLELLGLLLLLAGADPGPLPGLERLLTWAIGVLGPAILIWQRPADLCSLLLIQVPVRARSEDQLRLAALQSPLTTRVTTLLGASALLPLFWWIDQHAALAALLSPLAASPRFVALLLACPLLSLMLWQWQELVQAIALLSRSPAALEACPPMTRTELEDKRLCLGLPLLLLEPLQIAKPGKTIPASETAEASAAGPVAIQPEEAAEHTEGTELDQQID